MVLKDRERKRKKPNKKITWPKINFKHLAGKPTVSNCVAAYLKPLQAVFRGNPQ